MYLPPFNSDGYLGTIGFSIHQLYTPNRPFKGAVHSMTRNIAVDHGQDGIRCNAIAPGWINTPFNENLINQFADPKAVEQIHALPPPGSLGSPEDIAELALWLASDKSTFINGQVLTIDGGRMTKRGLGNFLPDLVN